MDESVLNQDPSTEYPFNFTFSDCSTINSQDYKGPFVPYIAAEMSAANLETKFIVGGRKVGDNVVNKRCNGPLLSGVSYSVFVRAYPLTLGQLAQQQQSRRKRNADISGRQYAVFSSSSFLKPPVTTGE